MTRVASLYLPQLAIERLRRGDRLRRSERPAKPPEAPPAPAQSRFPTPIDDDPGACSVPRGGGWRPGARWALADHGAAAWRQGGTSGGKPSQGEIDALPAHQRPTMREVGRRGEAADNPFKAMPPHEGAPGYALAAPLPLVGAWARTTILIERVGQRDVVTAACPLALELGLRPGMAAAHARALVTALLQKS